MRDLKPTGYITEIANLVPACGKCNSSKGGADWRTWMLSTTAASSPTRRGIVDVAQRMEYLERFEEWREPIWIDFASIVGKGEWEKYWGSRDRMLDEMMDCQAAADQILAIVEQSLRA